MNINNSQISQLKTLCEKYAVDRMYLFGSVLTADFSEKSDIDFLVKFKPIDLANYFDNYIGLKQNLKKLFNREVDLVEEQTLKNPVLIKSISQSKALTRPRLQPGRARKTSLTFGCLSALQMHFSGILVANEDELGYGIS